MQVNDITDKYQNRLKDENLFIVLDRDGTVAPIVDDPKTVLPETTRESVIALSNCPGVLVGVLSARNLNQLTLDFGNNKIVLAGNYGLEIAYPDEGVFKHPKAVASIDNLQQTRDFLSQALKKYEGIILEDHGLTLCLHFHLFLQQDIEIVHAAVKEAKDRFSSLIFRRMPTSYEVLPNMDWSKGKALEKLDNWAKKHLDKWLYIYAGDSISDQPAFAFVNQKSGISIQIGEQENSKAKYQLANSFELLKLIEYIAELRNPIECVDKYGCANAKNPI
jgi:trehalose-phosphatase